MIRFSALLLIIMLSLAGCGGQASPAAAARERLRVSGMQLEQYDGCVKCHDEVGDKFGPSWRQIAARYRNVPGARQILINSIENGSSGKWDDITGGDVPMAGMGARVKPEHIRTLVDYILSLAPARGS